MLKRNNDKKVYRFHFFLPYWGNCALYKAFLGSSEMIKVGKTVISEMLGANSKTAGWVEVLVMWGHELFQLDKTMPLGGELWKEIPSRAFEPLLQSCTTQRLAGVLLSCTDEFNSNFDRIRKKQLQKPFRNSLMPHTKVAKLFLLSWLDDVTSLPPQLSQLFRAIFEFCNGGRPKPEIIAQLITLLADIKTWSLAW